MAAVNERRQRPKRELLAEWTCEKCGQTFYAVALPYKHMGCTPGTAKRAANLLTAALADHENGRRRRTADEVDACRAVCVDCPSDMYDAEKDICTHPSCGCRIGAKRIGVVQEAVQIVATGAVGLPPTKPEAASEDCPRKHWPKLES